MNPFIAYRAHGQRYACFAASKLAFVFLLVALAILTLVSPMLSGGVFHLAYEAANWIIGAAGGLAIYIALESVYWWLRFRRGVPTGIFYK